MASAEMVAQPDQVVAGGVAEFDLDHSTHGARKTALSATGELSW
jgi:hypothetical protein